MNRAATSMLEDADLICVLIDVNDYTHDDEKILQRVSQYRNVLVVLNKIDQSGREAALPIMQKVAKQGPDFESIPVSALSGDNLDHLLEIIIARLPPGLPQFPADQLTDKSMRFISAEIIREKLFRVLKQELPYSITVSIDHYIEEEDITRISATIWVERKSQKAIVIGKNGSQLKKTGSLARSDIERLIGVRVYLQLWVKVRADWADDEQSLASFGYSDGSSGH